MDVYLCGNQIDVCVYHCKYIVYIISFYSFVLVATVQVQVQASG